MYVSAVIDGGSHPFPFRTRKLSLLSPMVLGLRARESRSLQDSRPACRKRRAGLFLCPRCHARAGGHLLAGPEPVTGCPRRTRGWRATACEPGGGLPLLTTVRLPCAREAPESPHSRLHSQLTPGYYGSRATVRLPCVREAPESPHSRTHSQLAPDYYGSRAIVRLSGHISHFTPHYIPSLPPRTSCPPQPYNLQPSP